MRVGFLVVTNSTARDQQGEVLRCGDCYALVNVGDEHDHDHWHTEQETETDPEPYGWPGLENDYNTLEARVGALEARLDAAREALT